VRKSAKEKARSIPLSPRIVCGHQHDRFHSIARIDWALQHAERLAAASDHLMEVEQARWREQEIARNRHKPPRKKLYDC
jgi:hypothetical protein